MSDRNVQPASNIKSLRQLAISGTAFTTQSHLAEAEPFGDLVQGLSGITRQTLMSVAAQRLRNQAGYIPGYTVAPIPERCLSDETRPCSQNAMDFLFLMLRGNYPVILPEWLREVVRTGQHVQAEAVVYLLRLGKRRNDLRPMIKSAVGERGLWLAGQMSRSRHDWITNTKTVHNDLQNARRKETKLIKRLKTSKYHRETFIILGSHRYLWSDDLAHAFLETLQSYLKRNRPDDTLRSQLIMMALYFPPHAGDDLLEAMLEPETDYYAWLTATDTIGRMLRFRGRMLESIYEPDHADDD